MSESYASRLSDYPNKGIVGLPELYDTHRALTVKIRRLSQEIQKSTHTVFLTGAGISTAAKIPDFRGPNGLWTKEKLEKKVKKKQNQRQHQQKSRKRKRPPTVSSNEHRSSQNDENFTFAKAKPTLTHFAITKLILDRKAKYCITQNVDGLHRRSGLSRNYHSAVHGCVFTEKCARSNCGCEYFGDVEKKTLSFQKTGNKCEECADGGDLRDILLDWEDPVLDMERVRVECNKAELCVCLGTSLRIQPVGSLPLLAKKFVLINLQATPFDKQADFVVRAKVDDVMSRLMCELDYKSNWCKDWSPCIERKWIPTVKQNEDWNCMMDTEFIANENK